MIKLSDDYYIDRDPTNWILIEKRFRTAKAGKNAGKIVSDDQFHYFGNLKQLCRRVLDMELDPTDGMENLLASLHGAENMIVKALDRHSAEVKAMFQGEVK